MQVPVQIGSHSQILHLRLITPERGSLNIRSIQARDRTLDMPTLLLPSVQVNIRAGQLPPAEANGVSYLKLPVNAL